MTELHIPTTLLLITLVSAVFAGVLGLQARGQRTEAASWAAALALQATAFALLWVQGWAAAGWVAALAGLALSAASALVAVGLYRCQHRVPLRVLVWSPVLLAGVVGAGPAGSLPARLSLLALLLALQWALVLGVLWQRRRQASGTGPGLLAAGAGLIVLIALGRVGASLAGAGQTTLFSGPAPGAAGIALALLLVALGLLGMVQEGAASTLRAGRASEHFRAGLLERLSRGQPLPVLLTAFALGVECLQPGRWCHLVLRPALAVPLDTLETPALPGGAGEAARVSVGEDNTGLAAAFVSRAALAGQGCCHRQALPASDRQPLGLLLVCDDADAAEAHPAGDLPGLAALAGLLIERCLDQRRLREAEHLYRELIESANEGICVLQHGSVRYANPRLRSMLGFSEAELLDQPFINFVHVADRALVERHHQRRLSGQADNLRYPVRLLTRDQGARWFDIGGGLLAWQGQPATLNFLTDITERQQQDALVRELAYHDTLTGLANRRLLLDHLELALASNRRHGSHGALLFLDLDNFKPLNDRHGHRVGDLLLVEVARRLSHCVRELDTVARFGGDEFVVLLSGLAADADAAGRQAALVAEKARRAVAEPYVLQTDPAALAPTVEHRCTVSVGVVLFDAIAEREGAAEGLLDQADAAMYQAKEAGGNVVNFGAQAAA
ncbi:MAG: sensor domain-containing diguanylate cyclase [Rubrivivax sp.]|nr:sensor domain-containing diguanylate cyclase [Rubrivivax sp.]